MSVLVVNASYEPLGFVSWQRAVTMVLAGTTELVEPDGDAQVRSAGGFVMPRPAVIRLVRYVRRTLRSQRPAFNKANLFARDEGVCQVAGCGRRGDTIDHIVPRCAGGESTWENCVLMCNLHNGRKGDRSMASVGYRLKATPRAPRSEALMIAVLERDPKWAPFAACLA